MIKTKNKKAHIQKKHRSIRKNVFGCADRPRLAVFKSGKHIYVQAIDDEKRVTITSASTLSPELKDEVKSNNIEAAKKVGALIASKLKKAKIECVVFDRGGFVYHGKVAALADAVREAGIYL